MADPVRDLETVPLSLRLRVNSACDRFESEWKAGNRPTIEDHLEAVPEAERSAHFFELLALELDLRRARDEKPSREEYRLRFPDQFRAIESAFQPEARDQTIDYSPAMEELTLALEGAPADRAIERPAIPEFGDYELLEEIARGGMGVIYRARHKLLNRVVALKMILAGRFASPEETRRFQLEAEMAASFDHPNIVPVYDIGVHEGLIYFSMKLVEGESLCHHLPRLAKDFRAAAHLMATVARAVHYAHGRGFIHRDLKPANILVDALDKPHVTDFGLARRIHADAGLTQSGAILGTPSYMAPEQAAGRGGDLTEVVDVYSLGAVLYELMTGRPPFRAETVMETLVQVLEREPRPPSQVRPGIPPDLESICLRCLGKSPADRYPTAEALAEDLERFANREAVVARPASPWMRLRRWCRREPELAARVGGLLILGTLVQINYLRGAVHGLKAHLMVTAISILWVLASAIYQFALRRERWTEEIRLAWLGTEVVLITAVLRIRDNPTSSTVIVYALLIAAAGLWSRVRLVWWTTGLAEAAYVALVLDAYARGKFTGTDNNVNIVMGSLALTGFVVAQHVKRIWAISSYYENRPIPR
jgi:eukaryotic-like serine/threonine-protein kinase